MPATATPAGISQYAPRRSDQRPNSGWISELKNADASISAAASVYERPNRSFRNGSSAGSAPFAKSVAQWPADSAAIARLSSASFSNAAALLGREHQARVRT